MNAAIKTRTTKKSPAKAKVKKPIFSRPAVVRKRKVVAAPTNEYVRKVYIVQDFNLAALAFSNLKKAWEFISSMKDPVNGGTIKDRWSYNKLHRAFKESEAVALYSDDADQALILTRLEIN